MQEFAKRLQDARIAKGLTQKELASEIETGQTNIVNYEKGRNYPTVEKLKKICTVLDVSADWLIFGK